MPRSKSKTPVSSGGDSTAAREGASQRSTTRLTKAFVDAARPGIGKDGKPKAFLYWDNSLVGFGLRVSADGGIKSFVAQSRVNGKTVRSKVGRLGVLTPDEARIAAKDVLAKMASGANPVLQRREAKIEARKAKERGVTLRDAWSLYQRRLVAHKRSDGARRRYKYSIEVYLASWLDRPLSSLTRQEVAVRHHKLADEIRAGKYATKLKTKRGSKAKRIDTRVRDGAESANQTMRIFRAVYNRAMMQHSDLPPNPVMNVDWLPTEPKRPAVEGTSLQAWWDGVAAIPNTVRRDYLRLVLLTGLRRASATEIRWEHINWKRRALTIPNPKGGTSRAFEIPLTEYLIALLKARQVDNELLAAQQVAPADSGWVFPAFSATGHIAEPREKIEGSPFTIHALRRTFKTQAMRAHANRDAVEMLLNHKLPRDIALLYFVPSEDERLEWLRPEMQKISDHILARCNGDDPMARKLLPFPKRAAASA